MDEVDGRQKTNPAVDHWRGVTGSQLPDGGNVEPLTAAKLFLSALLATQLLGCVDARLQVRDLRTGAAVVQAQAFELRPTGDVCLDEADAAGNLSLHLPVDEQAIVAVRAGGFMQWSKPVAWLRSQPLPLTIHLEPVWMAGFLHTGLKPGDIIVREPCHCTHPKAQ